MAPLKLYKLKRRPDGETVVRKKPVRFDGMTEDEIITKYTLSDYLREDLDVIFVGINPSLTAAYRGRYYAGPGNHFYKLLYECGLIPEPLTSERDYKLLRYGIGLTNVVGRPSKSSADLSRSEIKEGTRLVEEKLRLYRPRIAVFNGKCIYEIFSNKPAKSINFGLQPERIENSALWVVPSSSARCAQFPRMTDKLCFYTALKKWLDCSKGRVNQVDDKEFVFDGNCKPSPPSTSIMWRRKPRSAFLYGGRVCNREMSRLAECQESELCALRTSRLHPDVPIEGSSVENEEESVNSNRVKSGTAVRVIPKWNAIDRVDPGVFVSLIKKSIAEKGDKRSPD